MTKLATQILVSPAKINSFLHITKKRGDGYHDIETHFALVDLMDKLYFTPTNAQTYVYECTELLDKPIFDPVIDCLKQIYLKKHQDNPPGFHLKIEKNIPIGGGLGGGSSNAATLINHLNDYWVLGLSQAELLQVATKIGADVPVFLFKQSAFARGIGEQLTPYPSFYPHYLLVNPHIEIKTAALFQHELLEKNTPHLSPLPQSIENLAQTNNAFEKIVRSEYPVIDEILRRLSPFGFSRLSGTGATCFLAAKEKEILYQAQTQLSTNWQSWLVSAY
jgi:4-diphosphocytidyl-2-C-methyl-D-erythritol kinase